MLEKKFKCIGGEKIHSLVDQQHQLAEDVSSVMDVVKAMKETGEATVSLNTRAHIWVPEALTLCNWFRRLIRKVVTLTKKVSL